MHLQKPRSILLACHSDYISLDFRIHPGAVWDDDHTRIALFITTKAYRAPKGIARFPDGGISKTVFTETSLFLFEPETKTIIKTDLPDSFPARWSLKMAFTDSLVYYSIAQPAYGNQELANAETKADSLRLYDLKNPYPNPFVFNIKTGEISHSDSATFSNMYSEEKKAELQSLYNHIREVPLEELGLVLQKIYPKPDKEYINDFIYSSKGGSALTKRAIAEQIISTMSQSEIRNIIKRISDYANSLDGLEKQSFELYSEDKFELLKKLM